MPQSAVPSLCKICDEHCGILVSDDGNKVTITGNREHPVSKGFICAKGRRFGDVHHSPDRLTRPLLKKRSGWQEISYENALDVMASGFVRSKRDTGPASVALYKGEGLKHFELAQYMRHLANGFGSPNYVSVGSLCHYAQVLGHALTYGGKPVPDFDRIGVVLVWGANPAVSAPCSYAQIRKAVRAGTRLVTVDPVRSETAELAHIHLKIKPAGDGFLALAFSKHAIEQRGLQPKDDLQEGWGEFVRMVGGLDYNDLLYRAGIGEADFNAACSTIFNNLPGWTRLGLGLEHRPGGVQTMRAATCLQSILDPENRPSHMSAPLAALPGADQYPQMLPPIGADQTPLFSKGRREGQGMLLTNAILHNEPYPVRAMLIAGGNPMVTFPGVQRQREALERLDFLAVFDLFMTPTAQLADLVIPGADHLDNLELHDYGRIGKPYLGMMRPTTSSPKGYPTWKILFDLARHLGLSHLFPWEDNADAIAYRLSGTNVDFSDLANSESSTARYDFTEQLREHWRTKDGKAHYRSIQLDSLGQSAIPAPEVLGLPQQTDEDFPLWLSTGDRVPMYHHGQYRAITTYTKDMPEPILEIHPDSARRRGIQTGDRVVVSTKYGSVELQAHLTTDLREDCLRMTHGWEQANANELTGLEHFDTVSGFPWLKALPSRVERTTGTG